MDDPRAHRQLLVWLVESYNRDLLLAIAAHYNMPAERMLERYHTPYYYMPIIEEATGSHVVASRVHEEAARV